MYKPLNTSELKKLISDPQIPLEQIDVSGLFSLCAVFAGCSRKDWSGLEHWDVSHIESFTGCFKHCADFDADLSAWDVSSGTDFSCMFQDCGRFTGKGLGHWNMSRAQDLSSMFSRCYKFKGTGLEHWDVSNVRDFSCMFAMAADLDADLSGWDMRSAECVDLMFTGNSKFKADLSRWQLVNADLDSGSLDFADEIPPEHLPQQVLAHRRFCEAV